VPAVDEFRTIVNALAHEIQETCVGHDFATVLAATLTVALTILLDAVEASPTAPPALIVKALTVIPEVRQSCADAWVKRARPRES
jgi:hypothetical protein